MLTLTQDLIGFSKIECSFVEIDELLTVLQTFYTHVITKPESRRFLFIYLLIVLYILQLSKER